MKNKKLYLELKDLGIIDEMAAYDTFDEFYVAFINYRKYCLEKFGEKVNDLSKKYTKKQLMCFYGK
jgi:hypothetical protein